MSALEFILLIDDSDADNYYHRFVIERSSIQCNIKTIESSLDGIEYLRQSLSAEDNSACPTPQVLFLDINMPAMNGFELLTKFRSLSDPYGRKKGIRIFMLTGSLNPDDRALAIEKYDDLITGFRIKPLSEDVIASIVREFFSS